MCLNQLTIQIRGRRQMPGYPSECCPCLLQKKAVFRISGPVDCGRDSPVEKARREYGAAFAHPFNDELSGGVPRQISDLLSNQGDKWCTQFGLSPCKTDRMLRQLRLLFVTLARFFRSRMDLILENVALRQQLAVLRRRSEEHTSEL